MRRFILPFAVFVLLLIFLAIGLRLNPHDVPSPLIGKSAPQFQLSQLNQPAQLISPQDMKGKVWLLNVWASWCVSCREEHPVLIDLAQQNVVPIIGLNYKDTNSAALALLDQSGNPYILSAVDSNGRVGMDYGVYGVPETFVIDKMGIVRYKFIGPLSKELINEKLKPLLQELNHG